MVLFVTTVREPDPAAFLGRALEGTGAFRRFRNQLGRSPDLEQRWYVFSDGRRRGRARAWLAEHGYRPKSPPVT